MKLRRSLHFVFALQVPFLFAACGLDVSPPPVEVAFRDSLLGIGKIVQITNASQEALVQLDLRIEAPNGDVKNYRIDRIEAGATEEVGWKKLEGFEIPAGSTVEIRAEGFLVPYSGRLEEGAAAQPNP